MSSERGGRVRMIQRQQRGQERRSSQGELQECAMYIRPPEYPSEPDSRLVGVNDMSGVLCPFGPTIGELCPFGPTGGVLCQFGPTGHF